MLKMQISPGPQVYLIGEQMIDASALEAFLADERVSSWQTDALTGAEMLVEVAGRLCYMSFARPRPGGNAAYVDHLLDVSHGSVLEHAVFSMIITGVSRSFTHELVRHRAGFSYSQLSQRYVDESAVPFVVPPALAEEVAAARSWIAARDASQSASIPTATEQIGLSWLATMEHVQSSYRHPSDYLTEKLSGVADRTARRKQAREAARSVLPNATETKIFVAANARAWRHFLELRGGPEADAEMRAVALIVFHRLLGTAPALFRDYVLEDRGPLGPVITTPYRKV